MQPTREVKHMGSGQRLLITSVGRHSRYDPATYLWADGRNDRRYCSNLFPVALCHLLEKPPDRVAVLATKEALSECNELLTRGIRAALGRDPEFKRVPPVQTEDDILQTFDIVRGTVRPGDNVILDITHGFRSLPFVYLAALSLAGLLDDVDIEAVYYGAYDLSTGAGESGVARKVPVIDLTPMLGLFRWGYALHLFRETGDLRVVAQLLQDLNETMYKSQRGFETFSKAKGQVAKVAEALALGLPLESGETAGKALDTLNELRRVDNRIVRTATQALEPVVDDLECIALSMCRSDVTLGRQELERELRVIERYVRHKQEPTALLITREWLVNRVLLDTYPHGAERWLGRDVREECARRLNALAWRCELLSKSKLSSAWAPTEEQKRIASLWQRTREARNYLAHVEFTEQRPRINAEELCKETKRAFESIPDWSIDPSVTVESALVSCLGLQPGALYTALKHVAPEFALIITSRKAEGQLPEVLREAGTPDLKTACVVLDDPLGGFDERGPRAEEALKLMPAARKVVCNLAGGTTLMHLVVERVRDELRRLGATVKCVAVVDRRPVEEQAQDQYVCGELIEIDSTFGEEGLNGEAEDG